jgi:phage gp29-like protein
MADWVDKQISKLVPGQTMTADEGAGRAQSETHEKVRDDIADSDIQQIVETLNAALAIPYINLNFGGQEKHPKIDLFKPDEKNIEQIITAVEKLGPQGLKVKADEIRSLLGLSNPGGGDEVVGGPAAYAPSEHGFPAPGDKTGWAGRPSLNAEQGAAPDEIDELIDESAGGYVQISDDIAAVIEKAADRAADFESFREELQKLVTDWPAGKTAECIAVAAFKARAPGDAEFDKGEK